MKHIKITNDLGLAIDFLITNKNSFTIGTPYISFDKFEKGSYCFTLSLLIVNFYIYYDYKGLYW